MQGGASMDRVSIAPALSILRSVTTPYKGRRAMKGPHTQVADPLSIVRREFLELPGLQLTKAQVQRLSGVETATCDALLDELLRQHFLTRTQRGAYKRDTH
jgi:hypothetical protein